jgi:hypothetical protein
LVEPRRRRDLPTPRYLLSGSGQVGGWWSGGDDAVLIGAAELAFDELLADPLDPTA